MKKIFKILLIILLVLPLAACQKSNDLKQAISYLENGEYENAKEILLTLNGYKNANELLEEAENNINYNEANELYNQHFYLEAALKFDTLNEFGDAKTRAQEARLAGISFNLIAGNINEVYDLVEGTDEKFKESAKESVFNYIKYYVYSYLTFTDKDDVTAYTELKDLYASLNGDQNVTDVLTELVNKLADISSYDELYNYVNKYNPLINDYLSKFDSWASKGDTKNIKKLISDFKTYIKDMANSSDSKVKEYSGIVEEFVKQLEIEINFNNSEAKRTDAFKKRVAALTEYKAIIDSINENYITEKNNLINKLIDIFGEETQKW